MGRRAIQPTRNRTQTHPHAQARVQMPEKDHRSLPRQQPQKTGMDRQRRTPPNETGRHLKGVGRSLFKDRGPTHPQLPGRTDSHIMLPVVRRYSPRSPKRLTHCGSLLPHGDRARGEVVWGRDDTRPTSLRDLKIFDPSEERSKTKSFRAVGLGHLKEEGWRLFYTDGSGRGGAAAAGVFTFFFFI